MIDILIPTYNRSGDLGKNLIHLKEDIELYQLNSSVKIYISNNASSDDTNEIVNSFISKNDTIDIEYSEQKENVGLENNAVTVLSKAKANYIMFLGDDDFLPEGYLNYCISLVKNINNLGYVIPGLTSLKRDGGKIEGRIEVFDTKKIPKGYDSMLQYSHLGHQMSGILLKRDQLLKNYLNWDQYRNIYLFIYFLSNRIYAYDGIYAPTYKILVSVDNNKDWNYNNIGLLDEVFKSYYFFIGHLSAKKVSDLMIRFVMVHSYRIDFGISLIKNYKTISSCALKINSFRWKLFVLLLKEYTIRMIHGAKG